MFHGGTKYKFEEINLKYSNPRYDFGEGFYTSVDERSAETIRVKAMGKRKKRIVCKFDFHYADAKAAGLKILEFDAPNKEWLDFITMNRTKRCGHDYDIVIGPTSDGQYAREICWDYMGDGDYKKAIEKLKPDIYPEQIVFHTDISLKYLEEVE